MKKEMELFKDLTAGLRSAHSNSIRLYLITRHIKDGVPKSKKVLDKYDFKTSRIDLSQELQDYFKMIQIAQMEKSLAKPDLEICEYSVIDDDLHNKIYTYALNNALSFAQVVNLLLANSQKIKSIDTLKDIKDNLWAYCIRTNVGGQPVYSFRKIGKGRVGTDENDKNLIKKIQCAFNIRDSLLEMLDKETISLDEKIDCIYADSKFFVLIKSGFESMVGLEEEFLENASEVMAALKKSGCIAGTEFIATELTKNRGLLKRFADIAKKNNHMDLDIGKVKKMQRTAGRFGDHLRLEDNKVLVENASDLKIFIRALSDYYKKGEITGNYYGSNAGKLLRPMDQS